MEFNKINNLSGPAHDKVPRFITKKWNEVQSQSRNTYNTSKPIRFKTSMLKSERSPLLMKMITLILIKS